MCITAREQGIEATQLFQFFRQIRMQLLSDEEQCRIVEARFGNSDIDWDKQARIKAFRKQLSTVKELAVYPTLLNLLLTEFMLHEQTGKGPVEWVDGRQVAEACTIYEDEARSVVRERALVLKAAVELLLKRQGNNDE